MTAERAIPAAKTKTLMEKRFLSVQELSRYIGIKEGTIRVWVCLKKIPYTKVGRLVRFDLTKIDEWLEESSVDVYS